MKKVVGSIPIKSTNSLRKFDFIEVLRFAQDFGSRLSLRSRLLNASSSIPIRSTIFPNGLAFAA